MSSWDSVGNTEQQLKINGTNNLYDLWYRIVYDTPNYVQYDLFVYVENEIVLLRSWSKEKENIDARSMKDMDVYDLFSKQVEKYVLRLKAGISLRSFKNKLKENGLV